MHLKVSPNINGDYLSIVHKYKDPASKISKTKTIKSLGYLEALKKSYADPIKHFKEVVAEMNAKEAERKAETAVRLTLNETLTPDTSAGKRINLGYAAISKLFYALKLDEFFTSRDRRFKSDFAMASIVKTEVYSRILCPGSKKRTYELKDRYFERNNYL